MNLQYSCWFRFNALDTQGIHWSLLLAILISMYGICSWAGRAIHFLERGGGGEFDLLLGRCTPLLLLEGA